jgi:two-component system sensor histidine kinase PilS (NtrC family)
MDSATTQTIKDKLLALMLLRVFLALVFLGVGSWFQLRDYYFTGPVYYPVHAIVIVIGILTIVYGIALRRVRRVVHFAYLQVAIDMLLITAAIFITGGTESYFSILYFISVIGSSMILGRRGGFFSAALAATLFASMMFLDFYRILPQQFKVFHYSPDAPAWSFVMTTVATHVVGLFTVAYLMGRYAEKAASMERRLEEREVDLGRLETLNKTVVDNIPAGIMTIDKEGRITSFNKAATAITEYKLREVYLQSVYDLFPPLLTARPWPVSDIVRPEKVVKTKDGRDICLGFTVSFGAEGDATNIIIFQDLTELKSMEEQLRRDDRLKALGELSASIAHEVRNPLAAISGSIQMLSQDMELAGDKKQLMDIVLKETLRLDKLITDFLLFAKPAKKSEKAFIDIADVISETVKVFSNSPQAKGINIDVRMGHGLFVEGDWHQLSQVFWNLFLNAAVAMKSSGELVVMAEREAHSGSYSQLDAQHVATVRVTIKDTGVGIESDSLGKIFDPFFSTRDGGTGMGLALVHRMIEEHDATIDVASKLGVGTTFTIIMPLVEVVSDGREIKLQQQ